MSRRHSRRTICVTVHGLLFVIRETDAYTDSRCYGYYTPRHMRFLARTMRLPYIIRVKRWKSASRWTLPTT